MPDRCVVRCSSAEGRSMTGIYLGSFTSSGIVATWKEERARRFDSTSAASDAIRRLGSSFSGTTWESIHVARY